MCAPDDSEPNDTEAEATQLTGTTTLTGRTICGDEDWYVFDVPAGAAVSAAIRFTHGPAGDLDLYLYGPTGDDALVVGDSATNDEVVVLPVASAGTHALRVFEFADGQNSYDLELSVETMGSSCPEDTSEPNDDQANATPLGTSFPASTNGQICANNLDWYAFDAMAGEAVDIVLVFDNSEGDLDLELYGPDATLVAASRLTADEENIVQPSLPSTGTYALRINGYQGAEAEYLLEVNKSASTCMADASEPNDDPGNATQLADANTTLTDLTWCEADYFRVSLGVGESLNATVTPSGGPAPQLYLLSANGAVTVATGTPDGAGGVSFAFPGDATARDYLVEVSGGTVGTSYTLALTASAAPCDNLSCDEFEVCGDDGICASDLCQTDADCPMNYTCRQTYCVDACFSDSDCRENLNYSCRVLVPTDPIPFCAPTGPAGTGEPCLDLATCASPHACLKGNQFPGGMCATIGCASDADCDVDSTCVDVDGAPICLPFCLGDGDCRQNDGYSCQALPSIGTAGTIEVCIAN